MNERDSDVSSPKVFLLEVELALRWRQSVRTLQRWRHRGTGPRHVRFGRRVLYRMSDVLAYEAAVRAGVSGAL